MANTIWKEVFLIMCTQSNENTRYSGCFLFKLRITEDYTLQMLCGSPHNICNDEGKINGMESNRAIYDDDHNMVDVLFGPGFICSCSGENFGSLSDEQIERYTEMFKHPEYIFKAGGEIQAVPYTPHETPKQEAPTQEAAGEAR